MNVAILIRGLHYDTKYKDGIDYKKSIKNFEEFIVSNLKNNYDNIDIYMSTYNSEKFEECKKDYNVKDYVLNEFNEYSRHLTIANGLKLIEKERYDLVILYRFDIKLKMKILDLPNLKLDCINIPFFSPGEWKATKRINDGFYIFPGCFLNTMQIIFENAKMQRQSHNHFYKKFIHEFGEDKVNVLLNQSFKSQSTLQKNPLYKNRL